MKDKLVINADHYPTEYAQYVYIKSRIGNPTLANLEGQLGKIDTYMAPDEV